jgi:WD40 repeat protein/transcriptional regulator with XRE-family HTH domain
MKWPSNGEADASFGQMLLTLRSALNLTQTELAGRLGVSKRAIGKWEAGKCAPKAELLKQFIELVVRQQVFPAGQEAQQIRWLWKKARRKGLLDEAWLQALLAETSHQEVPTGPFSGGEGSIETPAPQTTAQPALGPRVDWGEALAIPSFYGREQELEVLSSWIVQERCRVVSVLGMGGIGKSALVVRSMYGLAEQFEVVLFRSLRDARPCETLLETCLQVLSPHSLQSLGPTPATLEQRITLLLDHLHRRRTLVVLDNLESLLDEEELTGRFRPGFEGYERLLSRMAQSAHQSCLLLTSREKSAVLRPLESRHSPVRSLRLSGLDVHVGEQLLAEKDLTGKAEEKARFIELYAGNPLALRIVSEIIMDLFGGHLESFLAGGTVVFGTITDLLDEHWARLSRLEQSILRWLAIVREPVNLEELQSFQVTRQRGMLGALDSLQRRSLIERGQRPGSFTLQSVVLEYVTAVLIATVTEEIEQGQLAVLIEQGLELAQGKEHIRQVQERLLLWPILARVQSTFQEQGEVDALLLMRLEQVSQREDFVQGYGPANLVALLRLSRGHLRGLDLSQLVLRGACLQGVEMQDAKLCGAMLHETTLTEAMPAIWSVAISRTGQYWVAGGGRGEVRVWREGGQRLHLAWQGHTNTTFTLALSPDESTLATGSWDGMVKLWEVHSGALLWMGWHMDLVFSVVFSPDGHTLASSGNDGLIQLWDVSSGKQIQTQATPGGPVYSLAWSPDGQLLAAGGWDSNLRLWQVQENQLVASVATFIGHCNKVHALAFSPDGTQLASGCWDGTVKLWDVASRRVLQTLTGHTQRVSSVAWSPDGRTVASASLDQTVWVWDVAQQRSRVVLHGHSAAVYQVVFTPDSRCLLSCSEDCTLRLWEVTTGQCQRTIEGYTVSLYDLDWSPDGTHLVSGSTDGPVIVWEVTGKTPPKVLGGHQWIVLGVGWSPDGRWLASAGWDNAIRVWEPTTGTCLRILRDPDHQDTLFHCVAWSPDGCLLASGAYLHGIYLWDVRTQRRRWIGQTQPTGFRCVAWSPDGAWLASGSEDGNVCLWEMGTGTLQQRLLGHHDGIMCVAWSPDGMRLASAGVGRSGGELMVWEVQSGACLQAFVRQSALGAAVTWDQSGDLLISGGSDGRLCWWEVQSGSCLRVRQAHKGRIWTLKRSPDGTRLASGGDDGAIQIWDLHSAELVQTLRRDRPYERLNITGLRGVTEAQKANLRALGALEEMAGNSP